MDGKLPDGWVWTAVGEIAITTSGGTPLRSHPEYFIGDIPWVKSGELRDSIIRDVEESITELGYKRSSAKIFPKDTVVVALYGATVGRTGILGLDAASNQAVCAIFPRNNSWIPKYMFYWLQSQRQYLIDQSMGGAQPNISQGIIRSLTFPLSPLPEQERIVARIESLFTRLDSGVAGLRQAQAALKRYRASVLKAACEGRLVPQDPNDEPAEAMLRRLGKKSLERGDLPELPEGWCWTQLGDLASHVTSGSRGWAQYYSDHGAVFIRAQDINTDRLVLDAVAHVNPPRDSAEVARTRVQEKDLLVTITGANVTKTALVNVKLGEAYMSQHVGLVRPILDDFSDYLYFWIISSSHGRKMLEKVAYGAGKPGLNLTNIRELMVAFPPFAEQRRIVSEIERRLSVVQEVEAAVQANLRRAARLRQAILKRAFEGRLG